MFKFKDLIDNATLISIVFSFFFTGPAFAADPVKNSRRPAPFVGADLQKLTCRGARIPFGPFDYRDRAKFQGELFITEEYHLTPEILQLQQATTTAAINDIQYTLMAWPNHPQALYAAYEYRLKRNRGEFSRSINAPSPVECHLQRAIKFSPNDPVPYMILGMLMHEFKHYDTALKSYRKANALLPNDVITLYNMGLTLVALERYEEAVTVAQDVYSTDFPLPGLKKKLANAGHWGKPNANETKETSEAVTDQLTGTGQSEAPLQTGDADLAVIQ
jgi:tetratricopeptide (TPR) repeat protein